MQVLKEQRPFSTIIGGRKHEVARLYDCHGNYDDVCIDGDCYRGF